VVAAPGQLFEAELPEGFHYRDDLISADEEALKGMQDKAREFRDRGGEIYLKQD